MKRAGIYLSQLRAGRRLNTSATRSKRPPTLRYHTDSPSKRGLGDVSDIDAIEANGTSTDIVETVQQAQ